MSSTTHGTTPYYFVPGPRAIRSLAAFGPVLRDPRRGAMDQRRTTGACARWLGRHGGLARRAVPVVPRRRSRESESGQYGHKIDLSFRWSMSWFIFSEVMFFGAFFTALWWTRTHSVPALGSLDNALLWPDFKAVWPSVAAGATGSPAGIVEPFQTMAPFWLPTINTALLLTSGVTLTIAHHALRAGHRAPVRSASCGSPCCWASPSCACRATSTTTLYTELNLKLSSGAYGSTFFMLTGFHGFHVFVGMLMLLFITLRLMKGHFTPERHFGFEGAAWYWHFVDVVWLGLYIAGLLALSAARTARQQRRREALFSWLAWRRAASYLPTGRPVAGCSRVSRPPGCRGTAAPTSRPNGQRARHAAGLGACRRGRRSA